MLVEKTCGRKGSGPPATAGGFDQSKVQLKLPAHRRAQTVVELPQFQTAGIVLHIARIEVIGNVENDNTGPGPLVEDRNLEALQDRSIQREEGRKATGLIAGADKLKSFVDQGKRKARADLERWRDRQIKRRLHFAISQETMRR